MSEYRADLVDHLGNLSEFIHLSCTDDDQARLDADMLANGRRVEVWQGERRLESYNLSDQRPVDVALGTIDPDD